MVLSRTSFNLFGSAAARQPAAGRAGNGRQAAQVAARRRKERLITGVDIGTTKVCVIIGSVDAEGRITVLGLGSSPSRGMRGGMVTDIGETVGALREAYNQAYNLAHVHPREVLVGIAGDHISGINTDGTVEVAKPESGIDPADIRRVKKKALKMALPEDIEILHSFVKEFAVNDQRGIIDPVGLFGQHLRIKMHVVISSTAECNNIFRCMNKSGLRTTSVVLQSLASSLSVLAPRDRELGVVLVDIGGGTSDVAVFHNKNLQSISEIAMGGDIITQDVAQVLRCTTNDAENLKKKFGHAVPMEVDADEKIELAAPGNNRRRRVHSRRELAEIIEARVEEIFLDVQRQLQQSEVVDKLYAGVVLTGGTALLEGIDQVAERILNMPCRIGRPQGLLGMNGTVNTPIYSTAVGLLRWAVDQGPGFQRESWLTRKLKQVFDIYG